MARFRPFQGLSHLAHVIALELCAILVNGVTLGCVSKLIFRELESGDNGPVIFVRGKA